MFNKDQFGFHHGRWTHDKLLCTCNDICEWIDQCYNVDVIVLYFCKAFDSVCHPLVIDVVFSVGIRGRILDWLRDFLHHTQIKVLH